MDIVSFVIVFERCAIYTLDCSMGFLLFCLRVGSYRSSQLLFLVGFFCVSLNSLFENTILIVSIDKCIELPLNSYAKELKRNTKLSVFK